MKSKKVGTSNEQQKSFRKYFRFLIFTFCLLICHKLFLCYRKNYKLYDMVNAMLFLQNSGNEFFQTCILEGSNKHEQRANSNF